MDEEKKPYKDFNECEKNRVPYTKVKEWLKTPPSVEEKKKTRAEIEEQTKIYQMNHEIEELPPEKERTQRKYVRVFSNERNAGRRYRP